jgi:hypothetical protein
MCPENQEARHKAAKAIRTIINAAQELTAAEQILINDQMLKTLQKSMPLSQERTDD